MKKHELICHVGDIVFHNGKKVFVSEILVPGVRKKRIKHPKNKGRFLTTNPVKADICVCRIMENGQVLRRSPFYIGKEWEHTLTKKSEQESEQQQNADDPLLRLPVVIKLTGLAKPTIYRMMRKGTFPQSIKLKIGGLAVGWRQSELDKCLNNLHKEKKNEHQRF
jgi:prophage regulatory protein